MVMIVDGEMSGRAWRRRLAALNVESALDCIACTEMDEERATSPSAFAYAASEFVKGGWPPLALIVWDSSLSMPSRTARSENDNAEVIRVCDRLCQIVRETNAAGLIVDHVTRGSATLVSRGVTAKFNAVDIAYGARLADGSVPTTIEPWSTVISVEKDRHGLLGKRIDREASFFSLGNGSLQLDITEGDSATHRLSADSPVTAARSKIAELDPAPKSASEAAERIGGRRQTALTAYKLWKNAVA